MIRDLSLWRTLNVDNRRFKKSYIKRQNPFINLDTKLRIFKIYDLFDYRIDVSFNKTSMTTPISSEAL